MNPAIRMQPIARRQVPPVLSAVFVVGIATFATAQTTGILGQPSASDVLGFTVKQAGPTVSIHFGEAPVLTYQAATVNQGGKWPRANYVHPLFDLRGEPLTEDFPADHGHHRGVFWSWHQVLVGDQQIGDAWLCEDFVWEVATTNSDTTHDHATIRATVDWKSPQYVGADGEQVPFVREQTTITARSWSPHDPSQKGSQERIVDFQIELLALVDGVRIGGSDDVKGYGGFSPRIILSEDTRFFAGAGEISPEVEQLRLGGWVNIVRHKSGVAILSHHDNPGFPEPWILRRAKSMQNAVFPGRHPLSLSPEKPLRLRYRLFIHDGTADAAQVAKVHEHFNTSEPDSE